MCVGIDGLTLTFVVRSGECFEHRAVIGRHAVASAVWSITSLPSRSGHVFSCGQDGRLSLTDIRSAMVIDEGGSDRDDLSIDMGAALNCVDLRPESVHDIVVGTDACAIAQVSLP